jgi:gliding motility-associated-like protein
LFTVSATDNGCPPKTTNVVYQVTVEPPPPPDSINGPPLICQNANGTYTVDTIPGFTFNWTVTNGSIISGQGTTTINANWPNIGAGTVSVYAISDCGCPSASIDTAITILASPATDAGPDTNVCLSDTIQIGGNPTGPLGTTYLWSPSTNINNTSIANPLVWPTTTTSYIVVVDNGTCTDTDTVKVTVGSPTLDAGPDTSFCIGSSTQLNATGGVIYSWTPSLGLSDTTIANPIATPLVTTTYYVTVTDLSGCTGTDSVIVTVNNLPTIILSNDTTVCNGACVQLNAGGGTNYTWSPGTGLSDSTISNPLACPIVTTTYYLSVTDANACDNTDSIMITVNPPPIITTNNDTSVCIGSCVQLNTTGGVSYVWTPTTGLSSDTIANPIACPTVTTTYIVTGTDALNCSNTDTVTITINSLPTVDAGNDIGVCVVGSVVIGGNPTGPVGSTYSWSPSATLNNGTLANPTASPIVTTSYTVTVTDSNGCVDSDVMTVSINALPIVDAGNDTTICAGESILIGGSPTGPPNSSYSWAPAGTLNNNTLANPLATPLATTEYVVTVTDSNSCVNTDSILISVNPLPIIVTSNDTALCIGDCYQLNAAGAVSYIWNPSTGLSNSAIPNPVACPMVTTTYIVTGTDANGCSDTSNVTITINPLPTITTSNDTTICIGTCAQLNASGGTGYLWSPGNTLSDSNIFNPIACPLVTTTYSVTVTDGNNCSDTSSIIVTINPLPVVDAGLDTAICIGDSTQLNATGAISYLWTPNSNITNTSIANPIVFPTTTSTYFVSGTNVNGCINTDSIIITVNMLPIIFTSNDTAICIGDCAQLNSSGGTDYLWTPGINLSDSTIFNPIACPTNATNYLVTVTDTNNCFDTASVSISINPLPVISAGPDLWLCSGDSIQLNATGGVSYLWTPSLGLNDTTFANPMASPLDTTNYIVIGFDTNLCSNTDTIKVIVNDEVPIETGADTTICLGDTVMLGGAPTSPNGTLYTWFPNGGTLNNATLANPFAFPSVTTTYYVVATNDTCTAIDSVTITVNQPPLINAGIDVDICIGDSAQLNANGGISYLWQPGGLLNDSTIINPIAFPLDTTEFTLFGTDTNGCSAYDSVIVNVNPLPIISAGLATTVCYGDSVQLNATGGISYIWLPSTGLSNDTIPNPLASPSGTTTYVVYGTDINSCINSDSIDVSVNQLVLVDLTDTIICIGEALQFSVLGPTGASYLWSPSTDLSNTTVYNPITTSLVTITYTVIVTDTNGCKDTTSILVTAEPKPIADFSFVTSPSCDGILADFTNLSIDAASYLWNFGDGDQSSEINPSHVFSYNSSSDVILTSYSSGLCADTISYPITSGDFEDYFNLNPPSVLTPNGDGLNDLFKVDVPFGIGQCVNIEIFNRWGMKVFDSNNQNSGWDGRTTAGIKVPVGTYFYIIEINGITKKGSLTLME